MTIPGQSSNGSQDGKSDENNAGTGDGTLQVGDKAYTPEDVTKLINSQATATQAMQEVAEIKAAAEKYGIDPKTFVEQAEGSFSVMSSLMDQGVIDNKGTLLRKENNPKVVVGDLEKESSLDDLFGISGQQTQDKGKDKTMNIVLDALKKIPELVEQSKKTAEQVAALDQTQANIIRTSIQDKILLKHPGLDSEDVSRVLAQAMQDRSKDVYEHARTLAEKKGGQLDEIRKQHAKEFGIDLKKYDENKLLESEPGGGAAILIEGKKMSFKKGVKGSVTPKEAMMDFMSRSAQKI